MLSVAALQYCASDDVAKTLHHIQPLIAEAASQASLVALPECSNYLAASREQLFQRAEWEDGERHLLQEEQDGVFYYPFSKRTCTEVIYQSRIPRIFEFTKYRWMT